MFHFVDSIEMIFNICLLGRTFCSVSRAKSGASSDIASSQIRKLLSLYTLRCGTIRQKRQKSPSQQPRLQLPSLKAGALYTLLRLMKFHVALDSRIDRNDRIKTRRLRCKACICVHACETRRRRKRYVKLLNCYY